MSEEEQLRVLIGAARTGAKLEAMLGTVEQLSRQMKDLLADDDLGVTPEILEAMNRAQEMCGHLEAAAGVVVAHLDVAGFGGDGQD